MNNRSDPNSYHSMLDDISVDDLLEDIARQLKPHCNQHTCIIGIERGGAWLAKRIHQILGITTPLGSLNIAFYRDDFTKIGLHPKVGPSQLPLDINDREIILIDDVLDTGRTIRAAMNELFDYGRPARIMLVVLIDRMGRELPIHADIIGKPLSLSQGEKIKLTNPTTSELKLELVHASR